MVAVAVGFQARNVGGNIEVAVLGAVLQARAPKPVATDAAAAFQCRVEAAFAAEALNNAARGVAVQAAERATQHFDARQVVEVEQRRLALTVWHGKRNAVLQQAHTAHTKLGAGAKATGGNLHILGVVLAVQREQTGNPLQGFRQVGAEMCCREVVGKQRAAGQWQTQIAAVIAGT